MSYTRAGDLLLSGLLDDQQTAEVFSVARDCEAMVQFETALARAQSAAGLIPDAAAKAVEKACASFAPDFEALGLGTARDGVAPPAFVAQLRALVPSDHAASVHFGATSQDLIDTSLMLRMASLVPVFVARLRLIVDALDAVAVSPDGGIVLMAHTRMQRALPFSVADKISTWTTPLRNSLNAAPTQFPLQLGGPEGTLRAMGGEGRAIAAHMGTALGLSVPPRCWHTDRTPIISIATWAAGISSALGKVGQDIALMGQNEVGEIMLQGGGKSSAMAHKNNPVAAESLVTLARFNATLLGGLHQAAVHENERSGAAWSLEWLLFPQLVIATGAALGNADRLIRSVRFQPSG